MTPISFLKSLRADPTDLASPELKAVKGDLSTDDANDVISPEYGNRAYALYLEEGDARTFEYADETTEQVTVFDIILEMQCDASPTAEQQAAMLALYKEVSKMPGKVTHLMPGVRLYKRLEYSGGLGRPRNLTEPKNWLTAGLRFTAHWRANF